VYREFLKMYDLSKLNLTITFPRFGVSHAREINGTYQLRIGTVTMISVRKAKTTKFENLPSGSAHLKQSLAREVEPLKTTVSHIHTGRESLKPFTNEKCSLTFN